MADAAIVIGINRYWKPSACLRGAVRDALRMREWLVSADGANVPAKNVFLLLQTRDDDPAPNVPFVEATRANVVRTILADLDERVGLAGDRLFFHYAGHGVNARIDGADVSTLLASDVDETLTDNSITYASILEFFRATQFKEQFFFFDACRNTPWSHEFKVGSLPRPKKIDPRQPAVEQYVCYATTPQLPAAELPYAESLGGEFTDALLRGLAGEGTAKVWAPDLAQYLVRWDELYRHVEGSVKQRRIDVGPDDARRIQIPQASGDNFRSNPVLARLPPDKVETLPTRVAVTGSTEPVTVAISDFGNFDVEHLVDDTGTLQVDLKPREYLISASSRTYSSRPPRGRRVDVYQPDVEIAVEMVARPVGQRIGRGLESFTPAIVTVTASDPVARVELVDRTGKVVASGLRIIDRFETPAGFYTARLRTPEGAQIEEALVAQPGKNEIELGAPELSSSTVMTTVMGEAGFTRRDDNTLDLAEVDGHAATVQLSTLLTLAALTVNKEVPWGTRLHNLGLRAASAFLDGKPGVQVLVGIERADRAAAIRRVGDSRVAVFRQGTPATVPEPLNMFPQINGFGAFVQGHDPGPCWVRVALGDRGPFDIATEVIPGRLTLLVLHETERGDLAMFQYLPSLEPLGSAEPRLMRSFELAQRSFLRGDLGAAADFLEPLDAAAWDDPLVTMLRAYIALKRGDMVAVVAALDEHLQRSSGNPLPDWSALQRILGNEPGVHAAGLPLFAEGLRRIDSQGAPPAPIPGFIWSVCAPPQPRGQ